jgi:malate dehydrogenase (oxaloacetate-decarboxylating)
MSEGLKVRDIMKKKVQTIDLNKNVAEAAKLMAARRIGSVVVIEGGHTVGIITERDVVTKIVADGLEPRKVIIRDVMSTPLVTIKPEAGITEAAKLMSEYQIRRIVVTDQNGAVEGIVTAADLARTLAKEMKYEDPTLNALARLKGSPTGGPYE